MPSVGTNARYNTRDSLPVKAAKGSADGFSPLAEPVGLNNAAPPVAWVAWMPDSTAVASQPNRDGHTDATNSTSLHIHTFAPLQSKESTAGNGNTVKVMQTSENVGTQCDNTLVTGCRVHDSAQATS